MRGGHQAGAADEAGSPRRPSIHINPTGRFVIGGPIGDCGLTGRKIIVDSYGGFARHGGGAFSGKDPSKVDRSAAYAARYVAKNVVAAGLARPLRGAGRRTRSASPSPTSVTVETFGTDNVPEQKITTPSRETFDLRPYGIIKMLDLLQADLPARPPPTATSAATSSAGRRRTSCRAEGGREVIVRR